ncbi:MAG: hypothetical protein K6F99_03890 [Lachnospiraceae bacterium]|nr:hypothetical protein [Lachnospiraceae bacterium]
MGMKFFPELYMGEGLEGKGKKLKKRLMHGLLTPGVYLLTLPRYGFGILEIYRAKELKKDFYQKYPPLIIGMASDETEAWELSGKIVMEAYEKTGSFNVRDYLAEKMKKEEG